ncbi:putative conserved lipoprotein LpqG [Actinoplanes lobatus]|uniref:Conserved lipoprotein LpqG n=1 Tax=Actinoplanes lobatus TaxID=113568 RepID=A0A7W7MLP6_9ACTN|nr:SIMPL domain-containing protein [Actinoplanes lobatus]MBB4754305.1 uncharacterized protein YggE [Actinoplanes lobatus]GGN62408.1 putative conserved lipoprotein LpqG [Actinoplanes lobatus]GIE46045.1 putative conserved lipoprotein LpqG [Actinoplanes lobatus]
MLISRVAASVAALTTLVALNAGPAVAASPRESVTVTGSGAVYVEPDLLIADFASEAAGATVDEALAGATASATRMRDTLVRGGTAAADLQTSYAEVSARRDDKGEVNGYTATQGLNVKIRNLPDAGKLLAETVAAGGDAARLNGVSLVIENDKAQQAEARRKAFDDARAKAVLYAGEADRKLGRVIRVSDVIPTEGEPGLSNQKAYSDAALPIEPGRKQVTASVIVEWVMLP